MVNIQLLDDAIKRSGLRSDYIAEQMGISRVSFSNKKNGHRAFKASEVFVIGSLLNLTDKEKREIFFPEVKV